MGEYQILWIHSRNILITSTVAMMYDGSLGISSYSGLPALLIWPEVLDILFHRFSFNIATFKPSDV